MYTIDAFKAKIDFSSLLEKVMSGESVLITKRGRAIAKIVPIVDINKKETEDAIQGILSLQDSLTLGLDWKKLRDEDRT